jgi:uncharacterized phiE125 gp8 family phage protein
VTFDAGYGLTETSVPASLRQALLLLVAHWYENREPVLSSGAVPKELPLAVESLLWANWVGAYA